MSNHKYILNDAGEPVVENDLHRWAEWLENHTQERMLAKTTVGEVEVSTVFLALDYQFGDGEPLLWETMVFETKLTEVEIFGNKKKIHEEVEDAPFRRYSTREQALAGHEEIVNELRAKHESN